MKMIKVVSLFLILFLGISIKCNANSYSGEANYIFKNKVEISRIDSFLFKSNHPLEEQKFVAYTLIRYKNEEAIKFFKKMLNSTNSVLQSFSVMALINAGEFQIAFDMFKKLIEQNDSNILFNFYISNHIGEFSDTKLRIYKKHKKIFIPFLIEVCETDSVSYSIKYDAARTLYSIGERKTLKRVCDEILSQVAIPKNSNKYSNDFTPEERKNWHLRYKAKFSLDSLYKEK